QGVDYAAPMGTPVRAAGDGRIRFAGRKGGYGNLVEIEHTRSIVTVYGHLSRFAPGTRVGAPVTQGAVIAYVGMTGLATGPHLHYINRELSFLEFNQRVLDQAFDESVPLLERLKFLCICCSNLDEFFEIRVAGLKQLQELGGAQLAADGLSIPEQLAAIHDRATRLVADQYRCLNSLLLPALAAEGVPLLGPSEWSARHSEWLEQYFEREIEPVLSPLG